MSWYVPHAIWELCYLPSSARKGELLRKGKKNAKHTWAFTWLPASAGGRQRLSFLQSYTCDIIHSRMSSVTDTEACRDTETQLCHTRPSHSQVQHRSPYCPAVPGSSPLCILCLRCPGTRDTGTALPLGWHLGDVEGKEEGAGKGLCGELTIIFGERPGTFGSSIPPQALWLPDTHYRSFHWQPPYLLTF